MRIEAFGKSDLGQVRTNNEDAYGIHRSENSDHAVQGGQLSIFVVADGVGGSKYGEVASRVFCDEVIRRALEHKDFSQYTIAKDRELRAGLVNLLESVVLGAGEEIYRRGQEDAKYRGMTTTGITLIVAEKGAFLAHVGDSRVYLMRGDKIYRLTEDHTVANQLHLNGVLKASQVRDHRFAHVLSRSLGTSPRVDVDTLFIKIEAGDRFLMCTDGLHNHLRGSEIRKMHALRQQGAEDFVSLLVNEANGRGGGDNITVVVVDVEDVGAATQTVHSDAVGLNARIGVLRDMFLFRDLNDQQIIRIMRITHQMKAKSGQSLIRDGDQGDALYIVLEGEAAVMKQGGLLTTIRPGGHFGELALIDEHLRSADVVAQTDMQLLTIERSDLDELLNSDPVLGNKLLLNFLRNLSQRVRSLSENQK